MANYLGNDLLMQHIDQYLSGAAPGGTAGLADFLRRHNIQPGDVTAALQATGRGDTNTVSQFVSQTPELQGWASGQSAPAAASVGGYNPQQIRDYISTQGIGNDPAAIHRAAQQYGVSGSQLDQAMGWGSGTADGYVTQQGWAALPGAATAATAAPAGVGVTAAPPSPYTPPSTQQPGMPSMGGYTPNIGASQTTPMATSQPPGGWAQPAQTPTLPSYNPYTSWMADTIGQRMGQNLQRNILPGIRSAASAAGGLGGSRQGIAEGIAIGDTMTGYGNTLANLYGGQFNQDRQYGLANDALDLNVYNANQNWMRQGQQDQLGLADRLLGWNQQYGVGNAAQVQNTPMNYWQQFGNQASQFAGLGGSQSQQMQGNPYLGALGGAMTAGSLWGNWGKP